MNARRVIKQPTGKIQDRRDGYVMLECPSCHSQGRIWERGPILNNTQKFKCHHCQTLFRVSWHREHKEPKPTWCDSFYISTNAKIEVVEETGANDGKMDHAN